MRSFEFAMKKNENGELVKAYPNAKTPQYQTLKAAGADFFCAEEVVIPSIWKNLWRIFDKDFKLNQFPLESNIVNDINDVKVIDKLFSPTLVHTGIKSNMYDDEVLELYNRSSNPKKLGLILANSVGVVDADYYGNPDNDGEIMFAFYNLKPWDVTLKVGDRIGQGVFKEFLRPEVGLDINHKAREGGFGSTNKN